MYAVRVFWLVSNQCNRVLSKISLIVPPEYSKGNAGDGYCSENVPFITWILPLVFLVQIYLNTAMLVLLRISMRIPKGTATGTAPLFEAVTCFEAHILEWGLHCFITEPSPLSCLQARLKPTLQFSTGKGLLSNELYWFVTKLLWHYAFNRHWQYNHQSWILCLSWKTLVWLRKEKKTLNTHIASENIFL